MPAEPSEIGAVVLLALALAHTFAAKQFARLAHHFPRHAGLLHLLAEVEVIFGFWAIALIFTMAFIVGGERALEYAESRNYREPLFVFVVMVIAGSRPVLETVLAMVRMLAKLLPLSPPLAIVWLSLAVVPLLGSLITEPAAMTISALVLGPRLFTSEVPERLKYLALGTLFVNISIGGTLSSYAAPPVLMVASTWQWDSLFMLSNFGWKAGVAVAVNASIATFAFRGYFRSAFDSTAATSDSTSVPPPVAIAHLILLAGVIVFAHHPVAFVGLFLLFLGFARAYERYQDPLLIKEALLVAFFLAGLVVLGGLQRWWLQPIVSGLQPLALFFGALVLTAVTDNAALTYLGSLIAGMPEDSKYMLVAGAVAGGGLTVIANAPNPAGLALLRRGFSDESVGAADLFLGALPPTSIAAIALLVL